MREKEVPERKMTPQWGRHMAEWLRLNGNWRWGTTVAVTVWGVPLHCSPFTVSSGPTSSTFVKAPSSGNERKELSFRAQHGSVGTLEGAGLRQEEEFSVLTKIRVLVVEWSAQSNGAGAWWSLKAVALILCECFHQDFEVENALLWDSQAGGSLSTLGL